MSNQSHTIGSPLHRPGVAGPVSSRAFPGSGAPLRTSRALVLVLGVLFVLALSTTSAQAAIAHKYISQFTGAPAGSFSDGACGVTVDPATQDVYVVDPGSNAIDIFEPSGAGVYTYKSQISGMSIPGSSFDAQFICSVAVSDVTGDVYLASEDPNAEPNHHKVVYVFNHLGIYIETMNGSNTPVESLGLGSAYESVIVDQSNGDVYVATDYSNEVDVFDSANKYVSRFSGPEWLAAVSSGDIYGWEHGVIYKLTSSGSLIAEINTHDGRNGSGITVDPAGDVYLTNEGIIEEYGPSGELEGQTRAAPGGSLVSAAANSSEDLIVADDNSQSVVDVFSPGIVVPGTAVQAPSGVGSTTAVLNGSVNPAGVQVTSCEFEYGTSASYGQSVSCEQTPADIGSGMSPVPVTATLSPLRPNATYYYRLNAADANGNANEAGGSGAEAFTTPGIPKIGSESAEVKSTEKVGQTHATLTAQVNPDGRETTYQFEYGETESYGSSTTPGALGSGEAPVTATTELSGLKVDTIYHYRVLASNECEVGKTCTAYGPDQTFTTVAAAFVEESVSDVAATSATLNARVNPLGTDTTAYFQYGTVSCAASSASCTDVPLPPGTDVGSVEGYQALRSIHLQSLTPGTVYHYRVIATNALGTIEGERNEKGEEVVNTFTTQLSGSAFALSDDRQWEMVSPPDKYGALIEPIDSYGLIEASADGSAMTYITSAPTELEPQGNANASQIFSVRSSDGWSSRDIATRNETESGVTVGNGQEYQAFSPDLSRGLIEPLEFTKFVGEETSPEATQDTPYVRQDLTCQSTPATCFTPLLTETDVTTGVKYGEGPFGFSGGNPDVRRPVTDAFEGATPDLSHVVLGVGASLTKATSRTPEAVSSGGLYEWSVGRPPAEQLQLVSVLPASEGGAPFNGVAILGSRDGYGDEARNAISNNGSRIIWSGSAGEGGALYMRDTATEETVNLTLPEPECLAKSACGSERADTQFDMASGDGSRVFFTDTQQLTADSRSKYTSNVNNPDLYVCQMVEIEEAGQKKLKCNVTDLSPDANPDGETADVQGSVLAASEDGSLVYFVADGVLGDGGEHGATPGNNLYVEHYNSETEKWEAPRFIATLSGADNNDWTFGNLGAHTSGSSPDGHYLAFMSDRDLTGYDTADAVSGEPDEEVYLYDAEVSSTGQLGPGKLVCASCTPTGARPVGERSEHENMRYVDGYDVWPEGHWLAANIPGWTLYSDRRGAHQPRYLSDSGRLFFNSKDALVPQDVNGTWDVYEYEPPGVGACMSGALTFSERSGGCVGLISSGESPEESGFLDASENGGDVFFATLSQLVTQDYDHSMDVYDARECTSESSCFPTPVEVPPACTTEASCKPSPTPQPTLYAPPASATFSGPGNLAPPPPPAPAQVTKKKTVKCAKGKVRSKHGDCVKQKSKKHKAKKASDDRRAGR